jgi:hypothetical protein
MQEARTRRDNEKLIADAQQKKKLKRAGDEY